MPRRISKISTKLFVVIVLTIAVMMLLWSSFSEVPKIFSNLESMLLARKLKIAISIVLVVAIYTVIIRIPLKKSFLNMVTLLTSVMVLLLLLEFIFMFVAKSHGNQQAYSGKIWLHRFWKLNDRGFRDQQWDYDRMGNKETILFMGDSFVAGHGIKNPEVRFSNIVAQHFEKEYNVINTGKSGIHTVYSVNILYHFPIVPNKVFLAHVPNDILDVQHRVEELLGTNAVIKKQNFDYFFTAGLNLRAFKILERLSWQSFLFNYIYWNAMDIIGEINSKEIKSMEEYQSMKSFNALFNYIHWYSVPELYALHLRYIGLIKEYCVANDVELVVILFPEMSNALCGLSKDFINAPLKKDLEDQGIQVLDFSEKICAMPQNKKVVNLMDHHPNALVNKMIAEEIISLLK